MKTAIRNVLVSAAAWLLERADLQLREMRDERLDRAFDREAVNDLVQLVDERDKLQARVSELEAERGRWRAGWSGEGFTS